MLLSLNQPFFPAVVALGRRFTKWWWKQFVDVVPERIVQRLSGSGRNQLTLRSDQDGLSLALVENRANQVCTVQQLSASNTLAEVDSFLVAQGLRRRDVDLGVELPCNAFFTRQILLPVEAEGSIDAIVAQDLSRKTPFRAEDIYYDYAIESVRGKVMDIRQSIVRRQLVQDALLPIGFVPEQIDFVTIEAQDMSNPQPRIHLRRDRDTGRRLHQNVAFMMSCSTVFLALSLGGLRYWNQHVALDRLDGEIAAATRTAQKVRTLFDQVERRRNTLVRLRLQRSEAPGLIDLWDEASRILPTHSWLTELRLSESGSKGEPLVILTGFSSAAPGLVATIDSSHLLFDAALISPVALDSAEGKERFTLQAKVHVPKIMKDVQQ
ncbi:MAG: hypothetical protein KGR71_09800 [Proteobacteria bacterium]|nr:hypothetical protein [Pseudomonadota bacterium]